MNEHADVIILETEEKMNKACNVLLHEFTHVRTGRANPGLLDEVTISYYGVDTGHEKPLSVSRGGNAEGEYAKVARSATVAAARER